MAKYFAFNTLAPCYRSSSACTEVTTAGRFNSTFADRAIQPGAATDYFGIKAPFSGGVTSITGTLYLRFDLFINGASVNSAIFTLFNGTTNAYRLVCTNATNPATWQPQYWNTGTSAWVNWGSSFTVGSGATHTYRLKLVLNTSFELTQDGAVITSSAVAPTNGVSAVTDFRFGNIATQQNGFYSQVMCADYEIMNSNFMGKVANGNGSYTDGTGTYTDINELSVDDDAFIGLPAVGNKKSFTKAAITVPSGMSIAAMGVNIRGRVAGGVVSDGKALIKSGASDGLSGSLGFGLGFEGRMYLLDNDPNTSSPFTQSAFNSAEFGMQAV